MAQGSQDSMGALVQALKLQAEQQTKLLERLLDAQGAPARAEPRVAKFPDFAPELFTQTVPAEGTSQQRLEGMLSGLGEFIEQPGNPFARGASPGLLACCSTKARGACGIASYAPGFVSSAIRSDYSAPDCGAQGFCGGGAGVGSGEKAFTGMWGYYSGHILVSIWRACLARDWIEATLGILGLKRNIRKSVWVPVQLLEFLGLEIDTLQNLFVVPKSKVLRMRQQAKQLLISAKSEKRWIRRKRVEKFAGFVQSLALALPLAAFYLRSLYESLKGCEASAQGFWNAWDRKRPIHELEMLAVARAIQVFASRLKGRVVSLAEDNLAVMFALTAWKSKNPSFMRCVRTVLNTCQRHEVLLKPFYVRSNDNWADVPSRFTDRVVTANITEVTPGGWECLGDGAFVECPTVVPRAPQPGRRECRDTAADGVIMVEGRQSLPDAMCVDDPVRKPKYECIPRSRVKQQWKELIAGSANAWVLRDMDVWGLLQASLSAASWRSYESKFRKFVRFCNSEGLVWLPPDSETLIYYVGFLAREGVVKAATSRPYFAAISTVLELLGYSGVGRNDPILARVKQGWIRSQQLVQGLIWKERVPLRPQFMDWLYGRLALPGVSPWEIVPLLFAYLSCLRPASWLSLTPE
ncbi:hypothetical protein BSKO_09213 [Bryopsis sp. KO-2023]|nr:hypothetical protein BSKO_09213 [Bryopsis sp. KO-2023]